MHGYVGQQVWMVILSVTVLPQQPLEKRHGEYSVDVIVQYLDRPAPVEAPKALLLPALPHQVGQPEPSALELLVACFDIIGRHDDQCITKTHQYTEQQQIGGRQGVLTPRLALVPVHAVLEVLLAPQKTHPTQRLLQQHCVQSLHESFHPLGLQVLSDSSVVVGGHEPHLHPLQRANDEGLQQGSSDACEDACQAVFVGRVGEVGAESVDQVDVQGPPVGLFEAPPQHAHPKSRVETPQALLIVDLLNGCLPPHILRLHPGLEGVEWVLERKPYHCPRCPDG